MNDKKRWKVTVTWVKPGGENVFAENHVIEEIFELEDIIEGGPDWSEYKVINISLEYQL
jgi:hypothetical protein